ncbi:UDP-glucose/GDP-mannose dehydrogenase family protein [Patescibacteria group bacterium]|nr:MAG: UDP-glucose/GDP-mannose dehydrogenase family protein [Patescibacteria group bacterium]
MVITIIGAGYVGLTQATIFANAGFKVYALEVDQARIDVIRSGRSFFYEANLDPLVENAIKSGMLIPTTSYEEALGETDVIFSCVGTPDNPDGSSNLTYVFDVVDKIISTIGDNSKILVQKSTVPVGTGEKIIKLLSDAGSNVSYVSNPEFLREGSALIDSLWFDRIVVGSTDKTASNAVIDLYKHVTEQRNDIAKHAGIDIDGRDNKDGEYITTSVNSAELIKVTANAFLATKITFANSIAKLADATHADINEVMHAVGADPRIGRSFLNAGRGFGGGCFPKDVSGLISSGIEYGVEIDILHAVTQENDSMPGYIVEKVIGLDNGSLVGKNVTVLGLSYKAGTSDVRRSPSVKIANLLIERAGAIVKVHDPVAMQDTQTLDVLTDGITVIDDLTEAVQNADAVFVATDWPEFTSLSASRYAQLMNGKLFVDCMNSFSPDSIRAAGLTYIGVGR